MSWNLYIHEIFCWMLDSKQNLPLQFIESDVSKPPRMKNKTYQMAKEHLMSQLTKDGVSIKSPWRGQQETIHYQFAWRFLSCVTKRITIGVTWRNSCIFSEQWKILTLYQHILYVLLLYDAVSFQYIDGHGSPQLPLCCCSNNVVALFFPSIYTNLLTFFDQLHSLVPSSQTFTSKFTMPYIQGRTVPFSFHW